MSFGFLGILVPIMLGLFVFHIWAIVDVVRTPAPTWQTAQENQLLWLVLVLFLSLLGPLLYVFIARPRLQAAGGYGRGG